MKVSKKHKLGFDEAKNRVNKFGEFLKKSKLNFDWLSDGQAKVSGKYLVVNIDAVVTVTDDTVLIEGKDPGFLWRKKAEEFISQKMEEYLK